MAERQQLSHPTDARRCVHQVLAGFQQAMSFADLRQHRMDRPGGRLSSGQVQAMTWRTASQTLSALGVMAFSRCWLKGVGILGQATRMIGARRVCLS